MNFCPIKGIEATWETEKIRDGSFPELLPDGGRKGVLCMFSMMIFPTPTLATHGGV